MKLSKRLRVISDFIPDNSFILDIGCDHALLDIYCVMNKKNVRAIASDINAGPLQKAKENIKKYDVDVETFLGDGLGAYEEGIDIVVMSGLGSITIVDILENGHNVLSKINKLIISSNNDYYYLRKSICSLGFYISDEKMVYDRGKFYPIIVFEKGMKKYNKKELLYGPIFLKTREDEFLRYLNQRKEKLEGILKSLTFKHFLKKNKIKREIKYINNCLTSEKSDIM